jgi:hypothetical protein
LLKKRKREKEEKQIFSKKTCIVAATYAADKLYHRPPRRERASHDPNAVVWD